MERPTCETCLKWQQGYNGIDGQCRANTPSLGRTTGGHLVPDHPITEPSHWCGEHPDFPAWIESQRKPRRVSKDEIIVVDPAKVAGQ